MKRKFQFVGLFTAIVLAVICVQPISASEKATKEECVDKVNAAVGLIQKEGLDASFKKIMDKSGPFIWKDSYVFCIGDKVGVTHAHPMKRLLGFPMKNFKDEEGKQPFVEVIEVAKTKGNGWKS
ncbi:MAG: sodium:calcium antiporter, partial [Bacteroidetes bacterium]|nr:sodium:calcium antiporter [Bacteroidota bacterium]